MRASTRGIGGAMTAAAAAAALAVAGCGDGSSGASTATAATSGGKPKTVKVPDDPHATTFDGVQPGSGKGLVLGYISAGDSFPFWKLISDSVEQQAKAAGARIVMCDSAADSTKALDCVKNFKTQGVQAYASGNVDAKASKQLCAAGPQVPVISISILQEPCGAVFTGADNPRAGLVAGIGMGNEISRRFGCDYDAVISLENPATGQLNTERSDGWRKGFEEVCGPLHDAKTYDTDSTLTGAERVFTDVLTTLPGTHRIVVFTLSDDMAKGALAAAKSQGRTDDVFVASQGADTSSHCDIKNDAQWVGDAAYFPEKWGRSLVPNLIRLANGRHVDEQQFAPHVFVDASNIDKYYDTTDC